MGAAASALPTTVEEALAAGFTQEQIDEHLKPKDPDFDLIMNEDLAKNGK